MSESASEAVDEAGSWTQIVKDVQIRALLRQQ